MPESTSDAFLSGHGVPVNPRDIETELTRLWGPAAQHVGGPDLESPHVTRIVLANLVVVSREADLPRLEGVLDEVTTRFPCRAIVLRRTDEPGRTVSAEVSALCHLPAPGMPQVCSERIELRAGPEAEDLLPGAVRPLLEADLPFVLWWTYDPREAENLFRDLGDECTRLILDLPDPGADPGALRLGLDTSVTAHGRDSAWFGLPRWRELVAQFFDPPCHTDALARIDSVTITALSPDAHTLPRLSAWLAAWLAGQLGWQPQGEPERTPGCLRARFRGPGGDVAVTLLTQADPSAGAPQILETTLTTRAAEGAETFRLVRSAPGSSEVQIHIDSHSYCTLPRLVLAPELDAARRVAGGLESSRVDPPFQHALPHLLWLLGPG
ncbi:MAG: glucose-6-phosphate dehydrogenase assembly protein OpcA [Isosphaeraceae bacterium]|nr:glucose-6-phosphate dehydrogenase assembly protein OpcA [Isosphaeraceae bacterium]